MFDAQLLLEPKLGPHRKLAIPTMETNTDQLLNRT